jgi:hypothetical protein
MGEKTHREIKMREWLAKNSDLWRTLVNTLVNFGFYYTLGISHVAGQLQTSQEGHLLIDLII